MRPFDIGRYQVLQQAAPTRIGEQDTGDWLALACALRPGGPVWTEHADFFGMGVAPLRLAPQFAAVGAADCRAIAVGSNLVQKRIPVPAAQSSLSQISLRRMNQGTYGAL